MTTQTRLDRWLARRGAQPHGRGVLVLIVDDVIDNQLTALPQVEALGGRMTFACDTDHLDTTGRLTSAQLLDVSNRGHEIAGHTRHHSDLTSDTVSQRADEYAAKGIIEGVIGTGKCTTFVCPNNAYNATVLEEINVRFGRMFGGNDKGTWATPMTERSGLLNGRIGWDHTNHAQVLAGIRRAARRDEVFAFFTHNCQDPAGANSASYVTAAQFTEVVTLAASLGIPFVRADEAFPTYLPILDPDFDDTALACWDTSGSAASAVITSTAATLDANYALQGTQVLRMLWDGVGVGGAQASSMQFAIHYPGEQYTASVRVVVRSGSAGNVSFRVLEYDQYGNLLATNSGQAVNGVTGAVAAQQLRCSITPNTSTRIVKLLLVSTVTGTVDWKHANIERTRRAYAAPYVVASTGVRTTTQATDTLVLGDAGGLVTYGGGGGCTVTVPPNSFVAFPIGTAISLAQMTSAQVVVAAGAGVTVNSTPGAKLRTQYSQATLTQTSTDVWLLGGDLTT